MNKKDLNDFLDKNNRNPSVRLLSVKVQKAIMISALLKAYDLFENGSGYSLHIMTEDYNINDSSIQFCLEQSRKDNNFIGEQISKMLLEFTEKDREILLYNFESDCEEILTIDEDN